MKQNRLAKVLFTLFVALTIMACGSGTFVSTLTPTTAFTLTLANTATPKPTATPRPTITLVPTVTAPPTPAPIGETINYIGLEITVIDVVKHDLIYPGGYLAWYLKDPSTTFIDMGVRVSNTGKPFSMYVKHFVVLEDKGNAWYPAFVSYKSVKNGDALDPFSIDIPAYQSLGTETVPFIDDTYIRLIYVVNKEPGKTILFGIKDSPSITFQLK